MKQNVPAFLVLSHIQDADVDSSMGVTFASYRASVPNVAVAPSKVHGVALDVVCSTHMAGLAVDCCKGLAPSWELDSCTSALYTCFSGFIVGLAS